jgi:preprotein translocase subunit SecD
VAAPTKTVPHPGRALAALVALIVIMLLGILGGDLISPGHWHKDFKVGLGLDLSSGTQVTMRATTPAGGTPSSAEMNEAISIILARVNGTGNSGAVVQTEGNQDLNVSVPGRTTEQTEALVSTTALLMFRQVLLYAAPAAATTTPSASPTASASATPATSSSPSASTSASPAPSTSSSAKTSAKIAPLASASASPSASASGSAKASPSASASASASPSATSSASASSTASGDASLVNKSTLALFNKLVCKAGDANWKQQIGYTNSAKYDTATSQTVACNTTTGEKYALAAATVQGKEITGAVATLSTTSNEWEVDLTLNGAGASAFGALTAHQASTYYPTSSTNADDAVLDQIAIVLDGNIVTAPETDGAIPGGSATISGGFTQTSATNLQNVLKYGSLPLNFKILSVQSVSPELGRAQLDGGLLAGAIGLGLVVIYSFLYYRGLGLVSVSSLVIAGGLAMLTVVLLSKYQSFALELSGIAGLIVAIGITADSFVVFFERLRDEVREGKQLRPAVEAGWKRARRTILVSDTVSFIAALLLYYFSIGEVKGFAYTLGLTTIIDIVVVFLFTKPMVTLLARTKFYGSGRPLSGLDPARLGAKTPWRSSVVRTQPRRRPPDATTRRPASRNTGEA